VSAYRLFLLTLDDPASMRPLTNWGFDFSPAWRP
jgi:hypothetical protein